MALADTNLEGLRRGSNTREQRAGSGTRRFLTSGAALLTALAGGAVGNEALKNNGVDIFGAFGGSREAVSTANATVAPTEEAGVTTRTERTSGGPELQRGRTGTEFYRVNGDIYYVATLRTMRNNPGTRDFIPENAVAARSSGEVLGMYTILLADGSLRSVDDIYVNAPMRYDIENMD